MKKTAISSAIKDVFSINTQGDAAFLKHTNYQWEDLTTLMIDLGGSVLEFMGQVHSILANKDIMENLGDGKPRFDKLVALFHSDLDEFSKKVKSLREEHESRTGRIESLNDYNTYNRISINYHALFNELTTLLTPTLSDLMLTVHELVTKQSAEEALKEGFQQTKEQTEKQPQEV